ncbi:DUF637 domain-containing protein [Shewanella sp. 38A_GOM-205m]|uniref:DUF637 domain-containing protein n=1 Tax=Shewanella sp. 38A_GOM-205m TaxID=1380363 RepID=UPI00048F768F|nr:DUF637 domain-containing protein [Shewanella sp. 38A_GOM-205m]
MISKTKKDIAVASPLWQRFTACFMSTLMLLQICLPGTVQAVELLSDSFIESDVNSNPQFERVYNKDRQFEKVFYINDSTVLNVQTIESFHKKLIEFRKGSLPKPQIIPIINNDVTVFVPNYLLDKRIGDHYVQSRFIRAQIFNLLNRNLISDSYSNEIEQINDLYNNAYQFSAVSSSKFGDKITRAQINSFGHNFIWPEIRVINKESVLVPIVHLTDTTVANLLVDSHRVEFSGAEAKFNTVKVDAGTIYSRRGTFINTAGNFTVSEGARLIANGDLNLTVGGTLQNLSGNFSAKENVNIIANQYQQKTVVHRFATKYEQGTRLGKIASVDAFNGRVSIRSYGDIVVQGGNISGENIILNADGNIQLASQFTTYVRNQAIGGYDTSQSIIEHTASRLSARDSIYLMASGAIELNTATLTADKGVIQILAEQGIYIANEFNEFQSSRSGKVGKVTLQEQEFQTIAIRSALEAGRGVLIASDFGDITLKATKIESGEGAQINAFNGKINLLLAKEQDHYFLNRVKTGFWRIKTETRNDIDENAVYNSIVGGIKVQATHGVTLELGQKQGVTLQDTLSMFEQTDELAWMAELYNDPQLAADIETIYQELVEVHKHDKSSALSPAAMAIIAIAMAVVMGPGAGLIGANGSIGAVGFISAPVMQAGAVTLATQTATSFASGNNLSETVKLVHSSDTIKAVATAMATAGAVSYVSNVMGDVNVFGDASSATSDIARNSIEIGNQVSQLVIENVVKAGISTVISGGNLADFGNEFVSMLKANAINKLGTDLAQEVEYYASTGNLDVALEYIAHASIGCLTGVLTSDGNGGKMCATGAGGSIVATAVSKTFDHRVDELTEDEKAARQVIKNGLDLDPLVADDHRKLVALEKWVLENGVSSTSILNFKEWQSVSRDLVNTRELSLGISRLKAALGVFIAGGTAELINNADATATNTAHSALWRLTEPAFKSAYALHEIASEYESKLQLISSEEKLTLPQLSVLDIHIPVGVSPKDPSGFTLPEAMLLSKLEAFKSVSKYFTNRVTLDYGLDTAAREVADGNMPAALNTLSDIIAHLDTEAEKLTSEVFVDVDGERKLVDPVLLDQIAQAQEQMNRLYYDAEDYYLLGERIKDISGASLLAAGYKTVASIALLTKRSAKETAEILKHFNGEVRKKDDEIKAAIEDFSEVGINHYLEQLALHAGNLAKQKEVLIEAVERLGDLISINRRSLGDLNGLSADQLLYKLNNIIADLPLNVSTMEKYDDFMLKSSRNVDDTFLDGALEAQYQAYVQRKLDEGLTPRARDSYLGAIDGRGNLVRGNLFNQYVNEQKIYEFSEVTVEYPNGLRGRIDNLEKVGDGSFIVIERKSYDLSLRSTDSFSQLLDNELLNKYPSGLTMKAAKYSAEGLYNTTLLVNRHVLELPLFNQYLPNIAGFKAIAARKGIELRFRAEPPAGWKP